MTDKCMSRGGPEIYGQRNAKLPCHACQYMCSELQRAILDAGVSPSEWTIPVMLLGLQVFAQTCR